MPTHSSILAQKNPMDRGLQSKVSERVSMHTPLPLRNTSWNLPPLHVYLYPLGQQLITSSLQGSWEMESVFRMAYVPWTNSGALWLGKKKKTDIGGQLPILDNSVKAMNFPFHRKKRIHAKLCIYSFNILWTPMKSVHGCHMKNLCSCGQDLILFLRVNSVDADPWGRNLWENKPCSKTAPQFLNAVWAASSYLVGCSTPGVAVPACSGVWTTLSMT